jgi:two-component system cell cycle sensor histidine kinase PleC
MPDWVRCAPSLGPAATCAEACAIFEGDDSLTALAVVEQGRPIGLVGRAGILACLADRFAPAQADQDAVSRIMDRSPLIVDASLDMDRLMALAAEHRPDSLSSGFVVTRDGKYFGIATGRSLLGAAAKRLSQHDSEMERKQLEAEESNKSKAQFLAAMSHELRTPLNAIIGFSQIIAENRFGPEEFERYRSYAQDIQSSGEHLLAVINDILDLSKVEAGKLVLREETVVVVELVESTLRLVRQRAADGQIALETEFPSDSCQLFADKRLLRQLLLNLVANAVKFTPPGGKVTLRVSVEQDSILFAVEDTGIGIAKADIPKAMMPFGQIDSRLGRKYDGTGLGLPLAKAMAEAHGGTLEIESDLGAGTRVTVRLPRERVVAVSEPVCAPTAYSI